MAPDFVAYRSAYRSDTAALNKFRYLNHASVGPLSNSVIAAVNEQLTQQQMAESYVQDSWFDGWRLSRQRVAELLGGNREDVCNLTNTWEGVSRAVSSLPLARGDEVLVAEDEFPSIFFALEELRHYGVNIQQVSGGKDGIVRTTDLLNAITPSTKLIAVSTVCFVHGYRHDLSALGKACRERQIWLVLDVIQSLGQLALDAAASGAHFICGQGAKWLCAPLGSGFLWVSPEVPGHFRPRQQGWFAMELNHDAYTDRNVHPKVNANRFGTGTVALPCAYGLRKAAEIILEAGPKRCEQAALAASDRIEQAAQEAGLDIASDRSPLARSAIISIHLPSGSAIPQRLRSANVVFSVRNGLLRLSPHWYTTDDELDTLAEILQVDSKG
jgi:selenocysteine lyase/cysteine desulfurase